MCDFLSQLHSLQETAAQLFEFGHQPFGFAPRQGRGINFGGQQNRSRYVSTALKTKFLVSSRKLK